MKIYFQIVVKHLNELIAFKRPENLTSSANIMKSGSGISFDWDPRKALANAGKHGVTFDGVRTVFIDEDALLIHDPGHSEEEDRFILLGLSYKLRLIVVCHSERKDVVRIISVRKATRSEQKQYQERKVRKQYDFSKAKKNPYAKKLKQQVTMRIDKDTLDYFKALAQEKEMPYQTLINLYLADCVKSGRKPSIQWKTGAAV